MTSFLELHVLIVKTKLIFTFDKIMIFKKLNIASFCC